MFIKGTDWFGLEGLSRLVLLQALAQVDPSSCANFEQNEVRFEMANQPPYSCILDGVQFVQVNPPTVVDQGSESQRVSQIEKVRTSIESV